MDRYFNMMIPNDGIYLENGVGWFIERESNKLYKWIPISGQCEYVANVPKTEIDPFRNHPNCIQYSNKIICLPDRGAHIWVYEIGKNKFEKIEIYNPEFVRLGIIQYWKEHGILWAWSSGLKSIIEIDMKYNCIIDYHKITDDVYEEFSSAVTKFNNRIYLFGINTKSIYEFDITSGKVVSYEIKDIESNINTILFDGYLFWLSGSEKQIYSWNKENKELKTFVNFPVDFEVVRNESKALFYRSICIGEYVCFVPWNFATTYCNGILLFNRNQNEMTNIKIYGEYDTSGSVFMEYILKERYIGFYCDRMNCILEIDVKDLKINNRMMRFKTGQYTLI